MSSDGEGEIEAVEAVVDPIGRDACVCGCVCECMLMCVGVCMCVCVLECYDARTHTHTQPWPRAES
jgi:hypothetical protein